MRKAKTWKLASFIKKSCTLPPPLVIVNLLCFDEKNFLKLCFCFYFYFFFISGDRIISVNGESVSGKSYAEVVILIQRLRDNLSLIVVPKQDDILQMVKLLFIHNQFTISIVQFSFQNFTFWAVSVTLGHFLVKKLTKLSLVLLDIFLSSE